MLTVNFLNDGATQKQTWVTLGLINWLASFCWELYSIRVCQYKLLSIETLWSAKNNGFRCIL